MWNIPNKKRLSVIPNLYETESTPLKKKLIYLHFFMSNNDWFVAEFDGDDIFFGYVILNGDYLNAEWGYFSFNELLSINLGGIEIDCELQEYWPPKPVFEIPKIRIYDKI